MTLKYTVSGKHEIYNMCDPVDVVNLLESRFICRKDVFAEQQPDGTYRPIRRELTRQDIEKHVLGEWTIGVYQLNDGLVKWACFDIDAHTPEEAENARRKLYGLTTKMRCLNIDFVIEPSGSDCSFHVWLFFSQLTDVSKAHYFCHELKGAEIECEVYPKQRENDPNKPYGNLVKLPKGKNLKNDAWSRFVPEPLVMVRTIDIHNYVVRASRPEQEHVVTVSFNGDGTITALNDSMPMATCSSLPMNVRPCIKRAIENKTQLTGAEGHAMRIAIVPEMRIVVGYSMDKVTQLFTAQGDFTYSRTHDQVKSVWSYNRISCSYLRKYAGGYVADMCPTCMFRRF